MPMNERIPTPLRQFVRQRAGGCCEYCLVPESHNPCASRSRSRCCSANTAAPRKKTILRCAAPCATSIRELIWPRSHPDTGDIMRLYHPRHDRWSDHFEIEGGRISTLDRCRAGYRAFAAAESAGADRRTRTAHCRKILDPAQLTRTTTPAVSSSRGIDDLDLRAGLGGIDEVVDDLALRQGIRRSSDWPRAAASRPPPGR